jgi:hypothetical protein
MSGALDIFMESRGVLVEDICESFPLHVPYSIQERGIAMH